MSDEYIRLEDAINTAYGLYEETDFIKAEELSAFVKSIPAADVAPVVRCRACKSYNKPRLGFCETHLMRMHGDDFCSYGKRKDGGQDDGTA